MTEIRPFRISIPESDLDDLRRRIKATRWPYAEPVDDWSQGVPLSYVRDVAEYWAGDYDWRRAETALNRFPQFVIEIDGVDIHFIHRTSPEANAFPVIMTHGWPGSVVEFHKVIEPLVDPVAHGGPAGQALNLVCPTLPGYGFSGKPTTSGWGIEKIAEVWAILMDRLGYGRFVAQGGDWGAAVATQIGRNGGACAGIHLNMPIGAPTKAARENPTAEDRDALAAFKYYQDWDSGYSKQQATRPQTLGYALTDSPVGQLAWILEKFWAWTDCDGHPENALGRDEMLDNVMLYWLTGSAASSARLYWESFGKNRGKAKVEVPTGVAAFPKEILRMPRAWCEDYYNITHWTKMDRGGHFAAFEQPEAFTNDVRAFLATIR